MPEPVTLVSGTFSSINASFKLADFCLSVQRAPEDIRIFSKLIQRVRIDRTEAIREFAAKQDALNTVPKKWQWTHGIISDTNHVLESIGQTVEDARIDELKGRSVTLQHRFEWVLSRKEKVLTQQYLLATCHQSLLAAIVYLQTLPVTKESQAQPQDKSTALGEDVEDGLRSPSSRRPKQKMEYVLPDSISVGEGFTFEDEWQFGASRETLVNAEDASRGDSWDNISRAEAHQAAADAVKELGGNSMSLAGVVESLQRATTDARKKRRDEFLMGEELGDEDEAGEVETVPTRNTSTLSRRRMLGAHFASD